MQPVEKAGAKWSDGSHKRHRRLYSVLGYIFQDNFIRTWVAILKRKWKAHLRFESYQSQDRVAIDAPRRQSVALN